MMVTWPCLLLTCQIHASWLSRFVSCEFQRWWVHNMGWSDFAIPIYLVKVPSDFDFQIFGQIETVSHRLAVHHGFRISSCHGQKEKPHRRRPSRCRRALLRATRATHIGSAAGGVKGMNLKDQWVTNFFSHCWFSAMGYPWLTSKWKLWDIYIYIYMYI